MSDAKAQQSPPVIDLTEEAEAAHSVTPVPQRPTKQRRISRRIQKAQASERGDGQRCETAAAADNKAASSSDESVQPAKRDTGVAYRKNDYYEV